MGDFNYSAACSTVAKITEGMSGREITNLALDWQMTTYASLEGVFTDEIMLKRAKAAVEHKKHKVRAYRYIFNGLLSRHKVDPVLAILYNKLHFKVFRSIHYCCLFSY